MIESPLSPPGESGVIILSKLWIVSLDSQLVRRLLRG
jgi:hypothetical protein